MTNISRIGPDAGAEPQSINFRPHPAAELFPMLDHARLAELAADIRENDLREPIQILDGLILDGRNRYRACQMAGVEPRFEQVAADLNPWAFVWSLNGQRRDLSPGQRHAIWKECEEQNVAWQAELKRIQDEANRKRAEAARAQHAVSEPRAGEPKPVFGSPTNSGNTKTGSRAGRAGGPEQNSGADAASAGGKNKGAEAEAKAAGVDRGTVDKNNWLRKHRPDLYQQVREGKLTTSRAFTTAKKEEKRAALEDVAAREVKAAQGVYDVIVLDPPWAMEKIEREVRPNQTAFDYPTMSEAELAALPIPAADDCHVWVWTTHKFLPMAFRLLDAWGLRYVYTHVWHKPGGYQPIGLPQYNCEFALYARKGKPAFIDTKAFPACFDAKRGAHSEKPQAFYDLVARVTGGRRLDMFNRRKIEGFDGWGNESA